MTNELVTINFHGHLGEQFGEVRKLAVKSVAEAIHAIDVLKQGALTRYFLEKDKEGCRYKVLVNDKLQELPEGTINSEGKIDVDKVNTSSLTIRRKNLKQIDIVPVLYGAEEVFSILAIVVGAILTVASFGAFGKVYAYTLPLLIGGLGLVAAGVTNLLATPPKFEEFRELEDGGRTSYLFNGPENVIHEGGPVPIGYGRLIVGSQAISASYDITEVDFQGDVIIHDITQEPD